MFVEHKEVGEPQEVKPLDDASKLLLKAAALIENLGLWRGCPTVVGKCVLTSLIAAEDRMCCLDHIGCEAFTRFSMAIGASRDRPDKVYDWNDSHSKDEVVAKLRAVAFGV